VHQGHKLMGVSNADANRRSEPAPQQQAGVGRLFLSGAIAACIAEATTLPLDTAKVCTVSMHVYVFAQKA
jgi:hypothetical protein